MFRICVRQFAKSTTIPIITPPSITNVATVNATTKRKLKAYSKISQESTEATTKVAGIDLIHLQNNSTTATTPLKVQSGNQENTTRNIKPAASKSVRIRKASEDEVDLKSPEKSDSVPQVTTEVLSQEAVEKKTPKKSEKKVRIAEEKTEPIPKANIEVKLSRPGRKTSTKTMDDISTTPKEVAVDTAIKGEAADVAPSPRRKGRSVAAPAVAADIEKPVVVTPSPKPLRRSSSPSRTSIKDSTTTPVIKTDTESIVVAIKESNTGPLKAKKAIIAADDMTTKLQKELDSVKAHFEEDKSKFAVQEAEFKALDASLRAQLAQVNAELSVATKAAQDATKSISKLEKLKNKAEEDLVAIEAKLREEQKKHSEEQQALQAGLKQAKEELKAEEKNKTKVLDDAAKIETKRAALEKRLSSVESRLEEEKSRTISVVGSWESKMQTVTAEYEAKLESQKRLLEEATSSEALLKATAKESAKSISQLERQKLRAEAAQ
jgi:hypothetical protein